MGVVKYPASSRFMSQREAETKLYGRYFFPAGQLPKEKRHSPAFSCSGV